MWVKDVMSDQVFTISSDDTIAEAAKKMATEDVGCLLVAEGGELEGIITDRDIAIRCCGEGEDPEGCTVADHMSTPVFQISPDESVWDAVEMMIENQVKRLPVTENGRLVGLLSFSDVAESLALPVNNLLLAMGKTRRTTGVPVG